MLRSSHGTRTLKDARTTPQFFKINVVFTSVRIELDTSHDFGLRFSNCGELFVLIADADLKLFVRNTQVAKFSVNFCILVILTTYVLLFRLSSVLKTTTLKFKKKNYLITGSLFWGFFTWLAPVLLAVYLRTHLCYKLCTCTQNWELRFLPLESA